MSVRPNSKSFNSLCTLHDNYEEEHLLSVNGDSSGGGGGGGLGPGGGGGGFNSSGTRSVGSRSPSNMVQSAVLDLTGMDWNKGHGRGRGSSAAEKKYSYTVGNSKIHFQRPIVMAVAVTCLALLFLTYLAFGGRSGRGRIGGGGSKFRMHDHQEHRNSASSGVDWPYDSRYPLTSPEFVSQGVFRYKIALVADLDTDSKVANRSNTWYSVYKTGTLTWNTYTQTPSIDWIAEAEIKGTVSMGGRGLELSELITFNGKLLTIDDRTGIIYQVHSEGGGKLRLSPWVILADGNGSETKGFKGEWATVKDQHLYVGGLGKEWTTPEGQLLNFNPMFVKRISHRGEVEHLDWHDNYVKMRSSAGIEFPGYMIHEAIVWSEVHGQWFALPRRASKYKYNEVEDERHGTNFLLRADEDFRGKVGVSRVGELGEPASHGFSSFKFVPGTQDTVIVALKSEELEGRVATYIMVFHIDGKILLPETKIGDRKFEGIEFV